MTDPTTAQISHHLLHLFMKSVQLHQPLYELLLLREKLQQTLVQPEDCAQILKALGSIQSAMSAMKIEIHFLHTHLNR